MSSTTATVSKTTGDKKKVVKKTVKNTENVVQETANVVEETSTNVVEEPIHIELNNSDVNVSDVSDVELSTTTTSTKPKRTRKSKNSNTNVSFTTTNDETLTKLIELQTKYELSLEELFSSISKLKNHSSSESEKSDVEKQSVKKPAKGLKKDGQPRKKAEHAPLELNPLFKDYIETQNIVSGLQSEDAEFGIEFVNSGRLNRLEIQQTFSKIIRNLRSALPEDATKSTVEKTNKKGETVIDNTYYRISGAEMNAFFTMLGKIIVENNNSNNVEEQNKFIAKITELNDKGSLIATINDNQLTSVSFPENICQQWHMSYYGFLTKH